MPFVLIQLVMVGLLIAFPQMSLVYKSGVPDVDPSKVRIIIPDEPQEKGDDILKDLQKGARRAQDRREEERPRTRPRRTSRRR